MSVLGIMFPAQVFVTGTIRTAADVGMNTIAEIKKRHDIRNTTCDLWTDKGYLKVAGPMQSDDESP
jgi:hypothetical protein